jgi:pleiotropic regulator 1
MINFGENEKLARKLFQKEPSPFDFDNDQALRLRLKRKIAAEYEAVASLPPHIIHASTNKTDGRTKRIIEKSERQRIDMSDEEYNRTVRRVVEDASEENSQAMVLAKRQKTASETAGVSIAQRSAMMTRVKPEWHPPWKLMRVVSGHTGWVRSICVEPDNQWFATGSADRTIKIWDLASGGLRLTLTGHIMAVRGLAVSKRSPYLFSCGEDKMVKCWDLEYNKVVRQYHGHTSGVYALDLHPSLDLLVTGGRDSVARVWDIRTRHPVFVLAGHKSTVTSLKCQDADPQVITGSMDATVRLWDLAAGKTQTVLTHHKKSVRAVALHPREFTFASASPDNIKQWKFPEGAFMHNFGPSQNTIINTLSVNADDILFAGGDDGSMGFYDWKSGHKFQQFDTTAVPGSIEAEHGILASTFDQSGARLLTCEVDKSVKVWREDPDATPDSHPGLEYNPHWQEHY